MLLIYSISFGHTLVPEHSHGLNPHSSDKESHCVDHHDDHSHIAHNNHFDDGLLDYLGCLVENLHKNLSEGDHQYYDTHITQLKLKTQTNFSFHPLIKAEGKLTELVLIYKKPNYLQPYISIKTGFNIICSRRGPPLH